MQPRCQQSSLDLPPVRPPVTWPAPLPSVYPSRRADGRSRLRHGRAPPKADAPTLSRNNQRQQLRMQRCRPFRSNNGDLTTRATKSRRVSVGGLPMRRSASARAAAAAARSPATSSRALRSSARSDASCSSTTCNRSRSVVQTFPKRPNRESSNIVRRSQSRRLTLTRAVAAAPAPAEPAWRRPSRRPPQSALRR